MLITLLVFLIIMPGVYVYISGRRFLKMTHDDTFALMYFKYQRQSAIAFWISLILFLILITFQPVSLVPLEYLNYYTLGLGIFLIFFIAYLLYLISFALIDQEVRDNRVNIFARIRFNLTILMLMAWPYVFMSLLCFRGREHYLYESIFFIAAYAVFYFGVTNIWSALLKATPVDTGGFRNKIKDITHAEKIPNVDIYKFSANGIKIANAFMVGNWGTGNTIFISEYAYKNLMPAELESIYLHEIGHLQKNQIVSRSVALMIPVVLIPVVNLFIGNPGFLIQAGMFIGALALVKLFVPSHKFEKEADEFATRYSSVPGNLIAGLEKIYGLGLLPRRFSLPDESRMTHPSLVNRIKHIRKFSRENLPVLEDRKEYNCQGSVTKITFSAATFTVLSDSGTAVTKLYSDVLAMFTSPVKNGCLLMIKFRDKGNVEKIKIDAPLAEINKIVDVIEYSFTDQPSVDPAQFAKSFTIQSILMIILGTVMLFLGAPAILVLGIIGLVSRTKRLLLSYAVSSLVVAAGLLSVPLQKYVNAKPLVFVFGIYCLVALYDYARFARLEEKEEGGGKISLTSSMIGSVAAVVVLLVLVMFNVSYVAAAGYSILLVNLCALSTGLALAHNPRELPRITIVCANILMLLVFILNRWF